MDLSRAIKPLIRRKIDNLRIIGVPSFERRWLVTATFDYAGASVICGSSEPSLLLAIIKTVSEIGEVIISVDLGRKSRTGLAGGMFSERVEERAKLELLERDAFLFHYRSGTPMQFLREVQTSVAERVQVLGMSVTAPNCKAVIALDSDNIRNPDECLHFGTGAAGDVETATQKALSEFMVSHASHRSGYALCKKGLEKMSYESDAKKKHKFSGIDPRNKIRFSGFFNPQGAEPVRRKFINPDSWKLREHLSPIRFFKFYEAEHPGLLKMPFGDPEPMGQGDASPLYHPFY